MNCVMTCEDFFLYVPTEYTGVHIKVFMKIAGQK